MSKILITCLALLALSLPASARITLVELFASNNCHASQKAHSTLAKVRQSRADVLVLTWSVDYWDYLGDADPMAMPEAKARQAAYVDKFGLRGAYTPQTVYDGAVQCPGNRDREVSRAIEDARARRDDAIQIMLEGETAEITGSRNGDVLLVEFLTSEDSVGDKRIHPVTRLTRLGRHERESTNWKLPTCESGCAVIVEDGDVHEVLAVARAR